MAVPTGKDTSRASAEELAALGLGRRGSLTQLSIGIFIFVVAVTILVTTVSRLAGNSHNLETARARAFLFSQPAVRQFISSHEAYSEWLGTYGLEMEREFFDELSELLFSQVVAVTPQRGEGRAGFFSRVYVSLLGGIERIAFVILASWKVLVLVLGISLFFSRSGLKVYHGTDFLGALSNGRLFYSGIKGKLHRLTAEGAPDIHVRGLACPATVSPAVAKQSSLSATLRSFGATGGTNEELISVVLANGKLPAFVARQAEQPLLEQSFSGATLDVHVHLVVRAVLGLHQAYRRGMVADQDVGPVTHNVTSSGRMSHEAYGELLTRTLHRVLTPKMRHDLAKLTPKQIATIVLALEAGKALTFTKEAGRWYRSSNFPHLCARSVLHSRESYGREYVYRERLDIRRAIIYASRKSIYAPVRFPVDLTEGTVAARQWAEVLLACPHELEAVGDDVELYGMMCEAHEHFRRALFEGVSVRSPEIVNDSFVVGGRLLVMPMPRIVAMFRRSLGPDTVQRLEELVAAVHQRQRLDDLSAERDGDGARATFRAAQSIARPLSHDEIVSEAKAHGVSVDDVREWSTMHAVLSAFGWIAQRVGDDSVPDSALCRMVVKAGPEWAGRNDLGLVARVGVVPLRTLAVEEKWGRNWAGRFRSAEQAQLAHDESDMSRKLSGLHDSNASEEGDGDQVGVAS